MLAAELREFRRKQTYEQISLRAQAIRREVGRSDPELLLVDDQGLGMK